MRGLSSALACRLGVGRHIQRFQQFPTLSFHAAARLHDDSFPNHYVTLGLARTSAPKDIKAKFYQLSKKHHPDHNRDDPEAADRFVKISSAYHILSDPTKRERYDRDYDRHLGQSSAYTGNVGPAGGRPASGLSRRRTQQGAPPPSYFRNAAWRESTGAYSGPRQGFDPATEANKIHEDVPHFDKQRHTRTQQTEDVRRQHRQSQSTPAPDYGESGMLLRFLVVGLILGFSVSIPFAMASRRRDPRKER